MNGLAVFSSVGAIILAAVTHAMLQMELSTMLLLYHASLGKHIKKKTRSLASNFILGSSLLIMLFVSATCYFIALFSNGSLPLEVMLIIDGILVALAVCIFFFYYRSGRTTELWLPKSVAHYIDRRAKATESNVESFGLGMLASLAEMPFSLALIVVASNYILTLPEIWQVVSIIGYTIISMSPTIFLRLSIRHGRTVVDAQKWRVKNKNFFKTIAGASFLTLALFLLAFRIMG